MKLLRKNQKQFTEKIQLLKTVIEKKNKVKRWASHKDQNVYWEEKKLEEEI